MRRVLAVAALVCGLAVVVTAPSRAEDGPAGPEGLISAEFDAFAVRVEYDIPLPAGTGTVPRVVGEVRRSGAGENAKGLAAAPTQFDAVVGGTYADPKKDSKGDEHRPPQVECFYPGDLVNTRFDFPTDTQAETDGAPAVGYATARCGAGPEVALGARNGAVELPGVVVGGGVADGGARPASGTLHSASSARASDIRLAGGAITIGGVDVRGESSTTGRPGGATTASSVAVSDVTVAGQRFSLANDRITLAGSDVALDAASTAALVKTLNASLAATGCRVDLLSRPESYPQGFVLGRKPPALGVSADGSLAASMQGGLLVLCDLPQTATAPTGFSPQRMQVLLGFAYTSVAANAEPGGFSLGGLAGGDFGGGASAFAGAADDGAGTSAGGFDAVAATGPLSTVAAADALAATTTPDIAAPEPEAAPTPAAAATRAKPRFVPVAFAMEPGHRIWLAILCLSIWALLTHQGLRRLRGVAEEVRP